MRLQSLVIGLLVFVCGCCCGSNDDRSSSSSYAESGGDKSSRSTSVSDDGELVDLYDITDEIFFVRHPEREGQVITLDETHLADEWLAIQNCDAMIEQDLRQHHGYVQGKTYILDEEYATERLELVDVYEGCENFDFLNTWFYLSSESRCITGANSDIHPGDSAKKIALIEEVRSRIATSRQICEDSCDEMIDSSTGEPFWDCFNQFEVGFNDLTGDDQEDAIVMTQCRHAMGGHWPPSTEIVVYGNPIQVEDGPIGFKPYFTTIGVYKGRLVDIDSEHDWNTDPTCCPSIHHFRELKWNQTLDSFVVGKKWKVVDSD